MYEGANPPRLLWECTDLHPQDAWCYIQALAVPDTAIVLSRLTLETYSEVSLLPTSLIDNAERSEQIMAGLPQMEISLDEIVNQLINEEIARFLKDFDQLLNTISQKISG